MPSPPRRILVVRNEERPGTVRAQQLEPLTRGASRLRDELGLTFEPAFAPTVDAIERAAADFDGDVAFVMVRHDHDPAAVRAMFERLVARQPRPAIVFHDCFDQSSSLFWDSLPFVDRYAKKVLLRDVEAYRRTDLFGGYVVADALKREQGYDFPEDWRAGRPMPADADASKVVLGWSFAAAGHYRRLATLAAALRWSGRPIDLNVRFGAAPNAPDDWYKRYRVAALNSVAPLAHRGLRLSGSGRVGKWRYAWEQVRSRAIFSPFGHGEICLRDVEAFATGAALLKPSVEHLRMSGELFEPGATYVPVKWDGSDVVECAAELLNNEARRRSIAREARVRFLRYAAEGWVRDVERVFAGLSRLG